MIDILQIPNRISFCFFPGSDVIEHENSMEEGEIYCEEGVEVQQDQNHSFKVILY